MDEYNLKYDGYLDTRRFMSLSLGSYHRFVYDSRYGVNWGTAVVVWMKRWAHWSGHGTFLPVDFLMSPTHMLSTRCIKELPYVEWLETVIIRYVRLYDEEFATHSLGYVAFQRLLDLQHLLTNLDQWL